MKFRSMLAAALLATASAALAQTAAPAGTVPGPQPVKTPDMTNAGSPRASAHTEKVPNLDHHDQKKLRKLGKVKLGPDATKNPRVRNAAY